MPTQLPPELIELVCPIPPVSTVVSGDFALPEIDQPSILYDANRGYTIVSADAFVAFQTTLASDLSGFATTYTNIDSMAARALPVVTTRVGPQGSYKDGSGYYVQEGSRALNASTFTPGTAPDSEARSIHEMLVDWSATMAGTPTAPGPTDDVVTDPTTPVGWFTDDTIVHGIRWKMLKQYCELSGGGSQYGTDHTPTCKLVGSFDTDLRPRLRDLSPGAMPLVWTDDGHLYLCCAVPLQVGLLRYVCELQLWERTAIDASTALTAGDVDQFFGSDLLAKPGTTNWLLRQDPIKFEDVAGLTYQQIDLSLYPPIPTNRSGHDIRGGQYGADFGYFWIFRDDTLRMYKFATDTLQVAPLSVVGSIPTGGSISPVATEVGTGTMARWEYPLDDTITAVWSNYYSSCAFQQTSTPDDDTIDVSGAGFTLLPIFTLCLPTGYGEPLDGPIPGRNWKYSFTNGFTAFMIDNRIAGIEYPYIDYSEPTVPQPSYGPYPFRWGTNQPLSSAGVDVVTCSTNHVVTWGPSWGMWPDRHWFSDKQVLCDETTLSIRDAPMNVSVNSSTTYGSVPAAPYKTFSSSAIGGESNYTSFTFPLVPLPSSYTPAAGYSVAFNDYKWQYLKGTNFPLIVLAEMQAQRFCIDPGGGPVLDTIHTFDEAAFLVNGSIQNTGASTIRTGLNNTTTFAVTNFDGNHVAITAPTVTQVPFRELVNCALHIGGFYINYDGTNTTSFASTSTTITFDIEVILYDYSTDTVTILDTFSHSVAFDPTATNGMLLTNFGDTLTTRITAESFLSLVTEYGVYVRLTNLTWDRTNFPVSPTIDAGHVGQGNTFFFSISLVRTLHNYNYFAPVGTKTNVKAAMSWAGTIARPWANGATWAATGLPTGLSISGSTGALTGTPSGLGPQYPRVTATHVEGATTDYYPIALVGAFSASYSFENSEIRCGRESAVRIDWFNNTGGWKRAPDEIAAEGLPPGMFLDAKTGVIRGVPIRQGAFGVKLVARWVGYRFGIATTGLGGGTDTQTLTITVLPPGVFADELYVTSPASATAYAGQPFEYLVETIGEVTTYTITGLPSGLSSSGPLISGTWTPGAITLEDFADVSVQVTRGTFSHTVLVRLRLVQVLSSPVFYGTGCDGTGGPGPSIVWKLTTEQPVPGRIQWSASGMPTGLTLDADSGVISGVPTSPATYTPTISVTGPDATVRSQEITIEVYSALDGRITQGSGWGKVAISGTTAVSFTPTLVLPSPWLSGLQVVRPIPAVYSGSTLAFGATGSCVTRAAIGGDQTVTFRNAALLGSTPQTVVSNTGGGGAQYYLLTIVPYATQDISNLPAVPDFLGEYYLVLEAQLGPANDLPGHRYGYWNTTDTGDYLTTIEDWLDNWPAAGMFFGTVQTPAASDSIQRIWFDKDARRQNPNCISYLDYTAVDTKPKSW